MADTQSLNARASQETFISLLLLEPAPIESPRPETEKELPSLPEEAEPETALAGPPASPTPRSRGGQGHGVKSHGAVYYLLRIQRYSSYVFFVFTTCHFITTSLVPLAARSVRASESYFLLTRELYQTPLSEPLLVFLPAAAHVASGLALRLLRRSQNLQRYGGATPGMVALHRVKTAAASSSFSSASSSSSATALLPTPAWPWPPFSTIAASGYALALFLGAHVALNRALPLLVDGDSANVGLAYVAHGFARHPALAGAAYVGLLGAGAGHMVWGWARWVGVAQRAGWWNTRGQDATGYRAVDRARTRARRRNFLLVNGVAVAVAVAWAAGGLGVVARGGAQAGWLGKAYDDLFQRLPFL